MLPRDQPYKDLISLINYILKKFFKAVQEDPLVVVEVRRASLFLIMVIIAGTSLRHFILKIVGGGSSIRAGNQKLEKVKHVMI